MQYTWRRDILDDKDGFSAVTRLDRSGVCRII
jgi:hypothetical protein